MIDKNVIDELGRKISDMLPVGVGQLQADVEANIRALLQATLSKMNLVTREEFDVQTELLQRTREKLEQLEQELKTLREQRKN